MSRLPDFLVTKTIELETGFSFFVPVGPVAAIAPEGVILINHKFVDLSKEVVERGLITLERLTTEAVSHEMLHKILFEVEGLEACKALDKIAYKDIFNQPWCGGL